MPETRQSLLSKLTTARQELIQAQVRVSELETLLTDHAETLGDAQANASDESIFVKLSDFPKENPNPVLAVARDGTLLYANPASRYLLALLDCQLGTQLPEILQATVAETFITATPREFEAIYDDIHFALTFVPVVNAGYGYLYGLDITERKRSELALKRYAQQIEILHEIDTSIINANTIPEVIEAILKNVRQIFLCQRATVILFDWVTNEWLIFADDANRRYSLGQEIRTSMPPGWDDGFGSETTRIFDDLRLSRPQIPHYETLIKDGLVSGIQALFVVQGNRIGLLGLNADTPGFFTAEHKEIVTQIASQLAIAVHQMHLTEEKVHHSQIVEGLGNFLQATMDAFPANMTVLDPDGKIISVNLPWKHFADDNDGHSETHYLGTNYLTVSNMAVGPTSEEGASAAAGIRAVIAGRQEDFYLEYPCHSPTEERWFMLRVTPFAESAPRRVVVAHINITERKVAEKALRTSEEKYRSLVDSSDAVIAMFDVEGKILYANQSAVNAFHLTPKTIVGKHMNDLFPSPISQYQLEAIRQVIRTGIGTVSEAPSSVFREERWYRTSVQPVRDASSNVIAALINAADITPFKQAEESLHEAHDKLEQRVIERTAQLQIAKERVEAILNNSPDAILLADSDFTIRQTNSSFDTLFACAWDEYFGKSLLTLLHSDDAHSTNDLLEIVANQQNGKRMEVRATRKDGTTFEAELNIGVIKGDGLVCTIRDITERKAQERQLRYHGSIQASVSDAVIATDMDFRIQSWNPAAEAIYGWSAAETIGKRINEILQTTYESEADRERDLQDFLEHGAWQGEVIQRHWDGSPINILASVNLFKDENGQPFGVVSVNRDITKRKPVEESLRKSTAEIHDLYNNAPCGYHSLDKNGLIVQINDTELKWLGYSHDEVVNKLHLKDLVTPESMQVFQQQFPVFKERGWINDLEIEFVRKDGNIIQLLLSGTAIYDEQGEFLRSRTTLFDVTALKETQRAVVESEARYRLLAENISDVIAKTNPNGIRTYITPSCHALLGYTPDELVGKPTIDIVHPDDRANALAAVMQEVGEGKTSFTFIQRLRHRDGHYIWVEVTSNIIYDRDTGKASELIGVIRDITEHKQAEDLLQESEGRYRLLAENIADVIMTFSLDRVITYMSPSCERLMGYLPEEVEGKSHSEFIHPEDYPQVIDKTRQAVVSKENFYTNQFRLRHKTGHYIWYEVRTRIVFDHDTGNVVQLISILRDITERKRAEDILRESEAKYRFLVETMRGGLAVFDTEFRVTYTNDRFCELLGYSREEVIGKQPVDFVDAANISLVQSHLERRQNAENTTYEVPLRRKDGQQIYVLISGSPLLDNEGKYNGSIVVATDIGIQKQAEETLRLALAKEKELGDLKSRFVSMASHEFRTPLATILVVTETLSAYRNKLTEEQIEQRFDKIKNQVGHLKDIMEDVLMLARMQARRVEFNPVKMDLSALARSILDDFEIRPDVKHRLEYIIGERNQEAFLDGKLMQQIISNLVSNAIKYSPEGKIVRIHLEYTDAEIILKISDEGIGIPEADLPHLFEPFHRAANVGAISGTGLGLVITREAVELHGGTITVESQQGTGTTFIIRIPISAEEQKNNENTGH